MVIAALREQTNPFYMLADRCRRLMILVSKYTHFRSINPMDTFYICIPNGYFVNQDGHHKIIVITFHYSDDIIYLIQGHTHEVRSK